ncbi:hypothetical protein PC116_g19832 [Phytophthora cactorum]|uniref:Uncharacterized protein n=2 Tax=Phytophthora cactorum TaxID=29920 RepID=A0A8T1FN72_9STRA|nr:hypothetical protein PC113_g15758 [Phytophthora cactorum]KAG2890692.1 hypothetical protein PC114_g17328 [Phytophthora cactorum]KAG2903624.1 hypothetical protein PC115_g15248 [Phytophthora cactorum]KAG2972494.1 hypothetical protein PC118_g15660 [Phytophthora cactorum]KAG3071451.1 hypothetical protein PC122_g15656 [Phytophthora cactorum]
MLGTMAKEEQTPGKAKTANKAKTAKNKTKKNQNAAAASASAAEERPFMVRVLTVGVASYLAHKVWTKRNTLTAGWYTEEQTVTEQGMVTAFEYLSSMGLIFVIGIVVGVIFSKVAKWVKGTAPAEQ